MLLVVWLGLSQAVTWHDASHIIQRDNHCALCASSSNSDHTLGSQPTLTVDVTVKPQVITTATPVFISVQLTIPGNRDPPLSA